VIRKSLLATAACLLLAGQAGAAITITFENLTEGAVLASQYASLGVTFSPNAFAGTNTNTTPQGWATNTGMTITSVDTGALGTPLLVSGNILHSFGDYLGEDGDPSMLATFSTPINSISIDFAGIFTGSDVTLTAYNGSTVLGTVAAPTCASTCQATLSFAAASITKVAFTPGSYADWVGVDNITFNTVAVPEVSTYAMMGLGLGLLAFRRRQRD
jgi:hypothetical protein